MPAYLHAAPLDERCQECGKYMLRTFERLDQDLCAGHLEAAFAA